MTVSSIQNSGQMGGLLSLQGTAHRQKAASQEETLAGKAELSADTAGKASELRTRAEETRFSSKMWSANGQSDFSMSTYTKNGTLVQVEAGERNFTLGNFQNAGQQNGATKSFQLAGARDDLNMQVIFTTADGNKQSFTLTETSTFHETAEGQIAQGRGRSNAAADPNDPKNMRDENNIVINMDDNGTLAGGDGDDILINFGAGANLNGNDGNDNLINMADEVTLNGAAGDDLIKVIDDVLRKPKDSTLNFSGMKHTEASTGGKLMDVLAEGMVGTNKGTEATIYGGDGNDVIDASDAKLERATVKGNAGDDLILVGDLVSSSVDGGDGNDTIDVDDALKSTITGGEGDDTISLGRAKSVTISGGTGNDTISADFMVDSTILAGDGNDTIEVGRAVNSHINAGGGDDTATVDSMDGSKLLGGNGNDSLTVNQAVDSVVYGGVGNDTIAVGEARRSEILGGEGDDSLTVMDNQDSRVEGGEGNDTIFTGSTLTAEQRRRVNKRI